MGTSSGIDIVFSKKESPKEIVRILIGCGFKTQIFNTVMFVEPKDEDYDWISVASEDFDLDSFLSKHDTFDRVVIEMAMSDEVGAGFIINSHEMWIRLLINTQYIDISKKMTDFSFYLKLLDEFLMIIDPSSVKCEMIY